MRGHKEEGTLGLIKGIGKGSVELVTKPGSGEYRCLFSRTCQRQPLTHNLPAMFGVLAYPAQGIYKSAKALQRSPVEQMMASGRTAMMAEDARKANDSEPAQLISRFHEITR